METPNSFTQRNRNSESLRTKTSHDLVKAVWECSELKPWTLCSLEPEQYSAMKKVEELWKILADKEKEKLVKLRDKLLTNAQIAEKLIPDVYSKYPWVAASAVSYALWLILWEDDRNEKTLTVISSLWKAPENVERLKEIAKNWIPARVEKYWEVEVFKQRSMWWKKSVELQWKKVLSEEEKEFIIKLCEDEKYRDKFWKIKRSAIADEVNKKFWNWENVRKPVAIADCYRRYKYKDES